MPYHLSPVQDSFMAKLRVAASFVAAPFLVARLAAFAQASQGAGSEVVTWIFILSYALALISTVAVAGVLHDRPGAGWAHLGLGAAIGLGVALWMAISDYSWRALPWLALAQAVIGGSAGGLFWLLARAPLRRKTPLPQD